VAKVYRVPKIVVNIICYPDKENDKFAPLPCVLACNLQKKKLLKGCKFCYDDSVVLLNIEVLLNVTPCSWRKNYRSFEVEKYLFSDKE
jgi:hypothetical protein